jgi:diacylglycerol kinase (ATP)
MFKRDPNSLASKYIRSFGYAFSGIKKVFFAERNFRFHSLAAILVISVGFLLNISQTDWAILALTIGAVLTAEAFNSAIEKLVDMVSPQKQPQAGWVKDVAAGAVLLISVAAAVVGLIIFTPYFFG